MSFEISVWDGLAKIGKYRVNGRSFSTPALFPVVHPARQEIEAKRLMTEFGFKQLITSTYLLSKKYPDGDFPKIHDLLKFDNIIMMDSGAYQLMVYGDVDLDKIKTMEIQRQVGTDIGVIMDHPIGYDVPYDEARERVETTIKRVKESVSFMGDEPVNWTLPIQGGKYIDLIEYYLDNVVNDEILNKYKFFALGSVVQVMIRQDYLTMVNMIIAARMKLPVKYPLHLFGAGHPSMFALATYLGCDTFDSAAYSLMAKDGRYMTTHGTYQIEELSTLPCVCPVCSATNVSALKQMKGSKRRKLLAEHNLWVSVQEIKLIKLAISRGELRNLVIDRMTAVPGLALATKYALAKVDGMPKVQGGIPVSKSNALRISSIYDRERPEIIMIQNYIADYLRTIHETEIIIIYLNWKKSLYKKIPDEHIGFLGDHASKTFIASPFFGLIPFGMSETYPLSQYWSDLVEEELPNVLDSHLSILLENGVQRVTAFIQSEWTDDQLKYLRSNFSYEEIRTEKVIPKLKERFSVEL